MKRIKEKKERALGTKLFLKAERCNSPKCVSVRRPHRPGAHGQKRHTVSEFGKQLQEKQKMEISYGLTNKQLSSLFQKMKDKEKIIQKLEHRLDKVVFLLGFTGSLRIARQVISHGHILVNGRKVTISSFRVRVKDVVSVRRESRSLKLFKDISATLKKHKTPPWLSLSPEEMEGKCVSEFDPSGERFPFDINLVGEFYAR